MAKRRWTDEEFLEAVRYSRSVAGVMRRLGLKPSGGNHVAFKEHARRLGADIGHFSKGGWPRDGRLRPLEEWLVKDSLCTNSRSLKRRLLRASLLENKCEQCGIDSWQGKPLTIQLDHINGDPRDNRIENLRMLCPNCHSQTDTWGQRIRMTESVDK